MNKTTASLPNKAQLRWACRRGMLELDLFLLPYVDHCYDHLSRQAQSTFARLLQENDTDLILWLMGQASPLDIEYRAIVEDIREKRLKYQT